MGKLKEYPKPVRETNVKQTIEVRNNATIEDLLEELKSKWGYTKFPVGAKFQLDNDVDYGSMDDDPYYTPTCYLVWVGDESDHSFNLRMKDYEFLIKAQAKRQAKKLENKDSR
jgi:hypothetical protein